LLAIDKRKDKVIEEWGNTYKNRAADFLLLPKTEQFYLYCLLEKACKKEISNKEIFKNLQQKLPPLCQELLQLGERDLKKAVQFVDQQAYLSDDEKNAALAAYILYNEIQTSSLVDGTSTDRVLKMAPHLRFIVLHRSFSEADEVEFIHDLLEKSINVTHLTISDADVERFPRSFLFCQKFRVAYNEHLTTLPVEMPSLLEFECSKCPNVVTFPAKLPCKSFYVSDCLQAKNFPVELLLTTTFHAENCPNAEEINTKLPLCKMFSYSRSSNVKKLPAELPSLETLFRTKCPLEVKLPKLPLTAMVIPSAPKKEQNPTNELNVNKLLTEMGFDAQEMAIVEANTNQGALSTYKYDPENPRSDLEKGLTFALTKMVPQEASSDIIENVTNTMQKMVTTVYAYAGCSSPEEFQARNERLNKLQQDANANTTEQDKLQKEREIILSFVKSNPEAPKDAVEKVNTLYDLMERDSKLYEKFSDIQAKGLMHFFKISQNASRRQMESMQDEEDILEKLADPLYSKKASAEVVEGVLGAMSAYWEKRIKKAADSTDKMLYEVAKMQLDSTMPSTLRVHLHESAEEAIQSKRENTIGMGDDVEYKNPFPLTDYDKKIAGLSASSRERFRDKLDLLKLLPSMDDQTVIDQIAQNNEEHHRQIINMLTSKPSYTIEEVDDE